MCMKSFIYDNYMCVCCLIVLYFSFTLFKNNMRNFLAFVSILIFACTFSLLVETDNVLDSALEKKYKKNELNKIYKTMHTDAIINESDKNKKLVVPFSPSYRPEGMLYDEVNGVYKSIHADTAIDGSIEFDKYGSSSSFDITQDPVFIEREQKNYQNKISKLKSYRNMINDDGNVTHWENSVSRPYRDVPVDRPYLDHSFNDDNEQKLLLTRMC